MNESKQPPILIPVSVKDELPNDGRHYKIVFKKGTKNLNGHEVIEDFAWYSKDSNKWHNFFSSFKNDIVEYWYKEQQPPADLEKLAENYFNDKIKEHKWFNFNETEKSILKKIMVQFALASGNKVNIEQLLPEIEKDKKLIDSLKTIFDKGSENGINHPDDDSYDEVNFEESLFLFTEWHEKLKKCFQSLPPKDNNEAVDEWISVEDRMPDHNGPVLCFNANQPDTEIVIGVQWQDGETRFVIYEMQETTETVTHWKELPNKPIFKQEQNKKG